MSKKGNVVYISGAITGVTDYKQKFLAREQELKKQGYIVINPAIEAEGLTAAEYMRISLARLEAADYISFLDGWERSKGATIEKLYAEYIGVKILQQEGAGERYEQCV